MRHLKIAILFFLLFCSFSVLGQKKDVVITKKEYTLNIHLSDKPVGLLKKKNYPKTFSDSIKVIEHLQDILFSYYEKGYLSASFDTINWIDTITLKASFVQGPQYKTGVISFEKIDPLVLRKNGIKEKYFINRQFNFIEIRRAQEKIITYYENNGHPFASVKLDSITYSDDQLSALCIVEKNPVITIDSVVIKGGAKISSRYLHKYLGVKAGDLYDESKINDIKNRLKELTFLNEVRPYEIAFTKDKARLYLYLKNKKSNQFDGILGILPNNETTGKVLLTGDIKLFLQNSFGRGEHLIINWQKLEAQTQKLNVAFIYPYVFRTPFAIDLDFKLFKKDTSFLSVDMDLGAQYLLQGGNFVKAYIQRKSSSLLSTDGLENVTVVPPYADVSSLLYGIGYKLERLDYKFNPRKGYAFYANIGAGKKKVKKNTAIPDEAYEGIRLSSTQVEAQANIRVFMPIGKRMTILLKNSTAHISNSSLFENELFRIGGFRNLRGFDEESILASSYSIFSLEYRFIFEQNSNFHVFFDGAWYEKKLPESYIRDTPFGFGIGLNLETRAGIFTISYALGRQFDNPLEIKTAKIHFGYVNRF